MAVAMIVAMEEAMLTRLPGHHLTRFIIVTVWTFCIRDCAMSIMDEQLCIIITHYAVADLIGVKLVCNSVT